MEPRKILYLSVCCVMMCRAAASAGRAPGCAAGRFIVTAGAAALDGATDPVVLVLDGTAFRIEGPCTVVGRVVRSRRKGTRLAATSRACAGSPKIRLIATARDCSTIRGVVRQRRQRVSLVAVPSTCGDGRVDAGALEQCDGATGSCESGGACSSDCRCDAPPPPLDCETAGYPCSWADVPPDVRTESYARAEHALNILRAGGTTSEAAAPLQAVSLAELQYDARFIRFRLPNGRPVWVAHPGNLGSDAPVAPAVHAANGNPLPAATPRAGRRVVNPGQRQKSALILDPFGFQPELASHGNAIATRLDTTDGYGGHVVHRVNTTPQTEIVGLDDFKQFQGNNVVYVNSHGGMLCEDLNGTPIVPCRAFIDTGLVDDPLVGANVIGVDMIFWPEWDRADLAVNADFFRHNYPGGVHDALIVFNACHTAKSDIARVLEGQNSNYVSWSDSVSSSALNPVMLPFIDGLAQGRAIQEVYASLGDGVKDPASAARLMIGSQDIRIRELPRVIDAFTGQTLSSESTLHITGYTDDGTPDGLLLSVQVAGAGEDDAAHYDVAVLVDGVRVGGGALNAIAAQVGDHLWQADAQIDLGFDAREGQTIAVEVRVSLPEGGTSTFAASPTVTGPKFSPGRVWHGNFTKSFTVSGAHIQLIVDATFERDPSEVVTSNHPTFLLTGGTMTWVLEAAPGGDSNSCVSSAPTTVTQLGVDEYSTFTFDLSSQPVEVSGGAFTEGPVVPLSITCPGPGSTVTSTKAGGQWFLAPQSRHFAIDGTSWSGVYSSAGQIPVTYEWNVERVE